MSAAKWNNPFAFAFLANDPMRYAVLNLLESILRLVACNAELQSPGDLLYDVLRAHPLNPLGGVGAHHPCHSLCYEADVLEQALYHNT